MKIRGLIFNDLIYNIDIGGLVNPLKTPPLNLVICCGLIALAGSTAAMANSVSASVTSSTGCGNTSQSSATSAGVSVLDINPPGPFICPNGDGIFSGADAAATGDLTANAEITGNPINAPFSVTSTATLTDTLTFSCAPTCPPGTLTGDLVATMTGAVFSQLLFPATEYASYAVTITDTTNPAMYTGAGELCPTLAQSGSCTMAETNPATGYSVSTQFTINPGDSYTFAIVMTSFVGVSASQTTAVQVLAEQNDPLSLTLPPGVDFTSQSGQFLTPEPSSWALVGGGLVLCLYLGRRRFAASHRAMASGSPI